MAQLLDNGWVQCLNRYTTYIVLKRDLDGEVLGIGQVREDLRIVHVSIVELVELVVRLEDARRQVVILTRALLHAIDDFAELLRLLSVSLTYLDNGLTLNERQADKQEVYYREGRAEYSQHGPQDGTVEHKIRVTDLIFGSLVGLYVNFLIFGLPLLFVFVALSLFTLGHIIFENLL